jgi:uncharacterized membrane protein YdbT with pleckstrin-like domain
MNASDVPGAQAGEKTMWVGRPSQWLNFHYYVLGLILIAGGAAVIQLQPQLRLGGYGLWGLALAIMFWKWLVIRATQLTLTDQRLSVRAGVLSRRRHDIELYRVKDTSLVEPLLLRLVSLGNIEIVSSDKSHPHYVIRGVRDAEPLRQMMRSTVERLRTDKRVRELDME